MNALLCIIDLSIKDTARSPKLQMVLTLFNVLKPLKDDNLSTMLYKGQYTSTLYVFYCTESVLYSEVSF